MLKTEMTHIEAIAERAAYNAIKKLKEEEKSAKRKGAFRNTELLLRHYNTFKEYAENAKYKATDLIELKDFECSDRELLYISSILRSKIRTLIMITHIDTAMRELKDSMIDAGESYKYQVIHCSYIDKRTIEETAEIAGCSVATVRRWRNEMVDDLSVLLFGVDGINLCS